MCFRVEGGSKEGVIGGEIRHMVLDLFTIPLPMAKGEDKVILLKTCMKSNTNSNSAYPGGVRKLRPKGKKEIVIIISYVHILLVP